jgi:leader peptidase (prepilin peptidase)/N-methyltransferase
MSFLMLSILAIFSYLLIFILLAALAWRDLKEYILPDILNAALALSAMAFHIALHWQLITPLEAFGGALAGGGLLFIVRLVANRLYHQDSLGLGDVKLMGAAGLSLGYPGIFMALMIGSAAGVVHGLIMAFSSRPPKKLEEVNVPAGVGLAFGIAGALLIQFGFGWLILFKK